MERPVFSEMLAERRRELGYSIRQASRVLRLREDVLVAFEEGDFEQMPKSGYAQGMLSSYARYLGLDPVEVVNTYADDYERYKRDRGRRQDNSSRTNVMGQGPHALGSERVGQPYVQSRGLLPTSGGKAGDLGTFSTTRVRPRSFSEAGDWDDRDDGEDEGYAMSRRPYTARTPRVSQRYRDVGQGYSDGDIRTMGVEGFDYYDDLQQFGNEAQRYESASSGEGRRSSRHISDARRPRVNSRRNGPSGRNGTRNRGPQQGGRGPRDQRGAQSQGILGSLLQNRTLIAVGAVVLVVVVLSLIIVMSVSSCVRQGSEARTVPVSATMESDATSNANKTDATVASDGTNASTGQKTTANGSNVDSSGTTTSSTTSGQREQETSVSVSVADGAVTWLEVECDGKSDVAQTITGPWQHTYTVEDAITIQAGDTTAVSVVQNGKQVQFDTMASGLGTLRIQGTKVSKKTDDSSSSSTGSSAKMGNNSSTSTSKDAEASDTGSSDNEGETGDEYQDDYSGYDEYGNEETYSEYDEYGNEYY